MKIVSLVPSITDLLYAMETKHKIAGITRYCIPPLAFSNNVIRVGGTKNVSIEIIDQIQPDLIIANKEENEAEQVYALAKKYPVWVTDISTVADALNMIEVLGNKLEESTKTQYIKTEIEKRFKEIRPINKTCIYLIWNHPIMMAGGDTFIHAMLTQGGFKHLGASYKRYPTITIEEIKKLNPEYLLLSSEPYAFREHHLRYYQEVLPQTKPILVDGQMFSWYGSKMLEFVSYINRLSLS